jgi:hypothetical protein
MSYLKYILGGIAVVALLGLGVVENEHSKPAGDKVNNAILASAYLEKNKDGYAKCYNSINYGPSVVGDVALSHYSYNSTDEEKAKIKSIENEYNQQIKSKCQQVVTDFENQYKTYKQNTQDSVDNFEPSVVRIHAGDPLDNFIFTRADVEQFFKMKLGE